MMAEGPVHPKELHTYMLEILFTNPDRSKNLVIYITCSRISHILKFFSVSHLYYPRANQFDQIEWNFSNRKYFQLIENN